MVPRIEREPRDRRRGVSAGRSSRRVPTGLARRGGVEEWPLQPRYRRGAAKQASRSDRRTSRRRPGGLKATPTDRRRRRRRLARARLPQRAACSHCVRNVRTRAAAGASRSASGAAPRSRCCGPRRWRSSCCCRTRTQALVRRSAMRCGSDLRRCIDASSAAVDPTSARPSCVVACDCWSLSASHHT